jgi:curved DNA-binding protein CbpA
MEINAYILLGFLPPQVPSDKEIKKRYLDLARLHHPDV